MDAGGRQIVVDRLEVIGEPTVVPKVSIPDGPIAGWIGLIRAECWNSEFDEYFERDDGQRFGVEIADRALEEDMATACCEELPVRLWGRLVNGEGYEGRRITVTRIEFVR